MKRFEIGKTYSTRSACDHNCIFSGTVVKRTEKTVTFDLDGRGRKTCRVSEYDGAESVLPFGRYSMAPIFRA